METVKIVLENHLLKKTHEHQRTLLKMHFPELMKCQGQHFLMLQKYINFSPQCFYLDSVYTLYIRWLKERDHLGHDALKNYLITNAVELNQAFLYLDEINKYDWHDYFDKLDDHELIRFIDQQIHPTYLRLVEAVFIPLLRIAAYFSRLDRNKVTGGLDTLPVIGEISKSHLSEIVQPYRHIVRNAIAHGGITYLVRQVRYKDRDREETYDDSDIIRNFDDMLDTSNAIALSLSIFLLSHQPEGYRLPQQLLLEELREETKTPWWEITGCVPSEISMSKQLVVYARSQTSDYSKVCFSTVQSGILAESFAPDYDRYFFSIRSEKSGPGWAAFDGKKLHQLRQKENACLEDYKGVIEDDLIFYVPHFKCPRIIARFQNFALSVKLHWPICMADMRKEFGWPNIIVRDAKIHRNAWGCVLNGSVYIESLDPRTDTDQKVIRKLCGRIIRASLSYARKQRSKMSVFRYLPLGFARIAIFRKNYRRRRLDSFGLGKDLICTIQLQRISRIKCPDIVGSTIEQKGNYRIAWNKAWLEQLSNK